MLPPFGQFVYLDSLNNKYKAYASGAATYSTFNLQKNSKNNGGQLIDPIKSAITQLTNIADSQNQIEHQAISNYLKKIDEHIKDPEIPDLLKNKLKQQKESIKNIDFENFTTNQYDLINAINTIQQDLNTYKRRLQEMITPVSSRVAKQRLVFDIQSRVENFLMGEKRTKKTSKRSIQRDIKIKERIKQALGAKIKPPELAQEIISLVFIDFNNWIENNKNISYNKILPKDIDELFSEYEEGFKKKDMHGQETHLQRIIKTNSKELITLANDVKKELHSTYLSQQEYKLLKDFADSPDKYNEKGEKIQESRVIKGITYSKRQAKNLVETYNADIDSQEGDIYAFSYHTATSHGNFFEVFSTIISSGVNISGNVGADLIIPIGTITVTKKEQQEQKKLMTLSNSISKILTDSFNQQQEYTIDNFESQIEYQQKISDSLQEKMSSTEKALQKISSDGEQFFIAHESLKLYRGAETKNSEFEEFHGREMNILSALSKLYASPILSDNMISSKHLITYLINISNATLANNKEPLETYLSLFAGLLMFDDIKSLAETGIASVRDQIQTQKLNCIHLYNIGGIYMPVSIFLYNLIEQLQDGLTIIDNANTATASIKGKDPVEPETSTLKDWNQLAQDTISSTTIQIHFLKNFTDYIANLFSN